MFKSITVYFPTSQYEPIRATNAVLTHNFYEHELAEIEFKDWDVDIQRVKPGTPIEITLDTKEFVGYVHDVQGTIDSQSNYIKLTAIGASYVMRQASQEVYVNTTASEVVKAIAIKHGFSYKIDSYPRIYKQISQAGLTDWELLVKLAKQCGYFLKVEGTTLYFQPLLKEFTDFVNEALVFEQADAGFKPINLMYSFKPIVGETLSYSGADKSAVAVLGIDPESETLFKVVKQTRSTPTRVNSQTELFDKYATDVVANDYGVGSLEAEAADEKSKFPYRAEATVLGNGDLKLGRAVYLDNIGYQYSGYWTILGIEHNIYIEDALNVPTYTTTLTLGTDSLGESAGGLLPKKPEPGVRAIFPNQRQTKQKVVNKLKSNSVRLTPTKDVRLAVSKNRTAPNKKSFEISDNTWSSDSGNLADVKRETRRSPAVLARVVQRNAKL
jgi:hypothetical protein